LRAKFTNDSNFLVREVGRGIGVLERSLEIAEVLRGEEGDDEDRKPVCTYLYMLLKWFNVTCIIFHPCIHLYLSNNKQFKMQMLHLQQCPQLTKSDEILIESGTKRTVTMSTLNLPTLTVCI